MEKVIYDIHTDLTSLLEDWKSVCENQEILEEGSFVEDVKNHILLLDQHCESLKVHNEIHDLISHLLHTPIGAPIVFKETLLECAQSKNAIVLHDYLKKSLATSENKSNFLFDSLSILDQQLHDLR